MQAAMEARCALAFHHLDERVALIAHLVEARRARMQDATAAQGSIEHHCAAAEPCHMVSASISLEQHAMSFRSPGFVTGTRTSAIGLPAPWWAIRRRSTGGHSASASCSRT